MCVMVCSCSKEEVNPSCPVHGNPIPYILTTTDDNSIPPAMKVFCCNCVFYQYLTTREIQKEVCNAPSNRQYTYLEPSGRLISEPRYINAYNNCKMYTEFKRGKI